MPEYDVKVENWMRGNQDLSDAQLRRISASKDPNSTAFQGATELLDHREKEKSERDHHTQRRRHEEAMKLANDAIKYAKWALYAALTSCAIGALALIAKFLI